MKRKILSLIATLFLTLGVALSGCSNTTTSSSSSSDTTTTTTTSNHEHTYSISYEYDDTYHWHPSTCGHDVRRGEERHTFTSTITDPTYEQGGYTTYTCSICGYSYIDNETNKLEHNYSSTWSYDEYSHWHACTDKGYEHLKKDESSHNFTSIVTDPTYEQGGYTTYTCSTCGYSYIDNETNALPITITWKNYDGSILEVDNNVPYGSIPSYDGDTPIKESDNTYNYIFSNWSPFISKAVKSATYVAQFEKEEKVILLENITMIFQMTFTISEGSEGYIILPNQRTDIFIFSPSNYSSSIYSIYTYSSDNSILSLDPFSHKAVGLKEGTVVVTYKYISEYNTVSLNVYFEVVSPIKNLAFNNFSKDITIFDDDIETLIVESSPSGWGPSGDEITFESSDPSIVSIFSQESFGTCEVQAHNIPGTVTITARSKILGITCSTTVTVKVTNIVFLNESNFNMSKTVMIQDEKYQLRTNMEASFVSLNTDILSVNSTGEVTALKSGHGQIKAISKTNNSEAILDIYVYNFNFDYPTEEFNLSNYYLINDQYVGDVYATCKIKINAIQASISLNYSGSRYIEVLMDVSAEKISGLDGEFKINSFIYNENGTRLDKTTFNLGYLSVGQKIEKELQLMVIYSNSETIDSVFDKTLRLEFDGVAW